MSDMTLAAGSRLGPETLPPAKLCIAHQTSRCAMWYAGQAMRTTLNLDDDLLHVAKQLAQQRGLSTGQVVSELVRQALEPKRPPKIRNGVPLFTPKPHAR